MVGLALVDELRGLPPTLALEVLDDLEAELGPEATAALGWSWEFLRRPAQRFPTPEETAARPLVIYEGEYGAGKTRTAVEFFLHLILSGRVKRPRMIAADDAKVEAVLVRGEGGLLECLGVPEEERREATSGRSIFGVPWRWESSKGHAGNLWIAGIRIAGCSAAAPGQALGEESDCDLLDDPPAWILACGLAVATRTWAAAAKSCRLRPAIKIVPTTPDGVGFLGELLGGQFAGVLKISLGRSEDNTALDENFHRLTKPMLQAQGLWNPLAAASPWGALTAEQWQAMRAADCPALVELAVSIDPAQSTGARACEVGILGGGRDARSTIHVRWDRSAVLDSGVNGWPAAAWDLAEDLQRQFPGVPWHFVLESNMGKRLQELLRGEERARRLRKGLPEVSICEIRLVLADRDKCKRAESPARLGAQGQVKHAPGMVELEAQQKNLTPQSTESDRADAENHLIADLAGLGDGKAAAAAREAEQQASAARGAFAGLVEAQEEIRAPAFTLDVA